MKEKFRIWTSDNKQSIFLCFSAKTFYGWQSLTHTKHNMERKPKRNFRQRVKWLMNLTLEEKEVRNLFPPLVSFTAKSIFHSSNIFTWNARYFTFVIIFYGIDKLKLDWLPQCHTRDCRCLSLVTKLIFLLRRSEYSHPWVPVHIFCLQPQLNRRLTMNFHPKYER